MAQPLPSHTCKTHTVETRRIVVTDQRFSLCFCLPKIIDRPLCLEDILPNGCNNRKHSECFLSSLWSFYFMEMMGTSCGMMNHCLVLECFLSAFMWKCVCVYLRLIGGCVVRFYCLSVFLGISEVGEVHKLNTKVQVQDKTLLKQKHFSQIDRSTGD